ncbi:glycosyltransferase family 4 protein [Reyranella sp. CPCC 100927]|uniref:glycosyltransferase family 4 protein n=1 Tax=Reyranella sp. CPCC 100927 TaxID=2599616 RepID=UPI0011B51B0B|nr:glycosyltransferase family 4 protein [Reyranella sp. CPCC 100927]TWT10816.1 glycosyltransferase family 4 protein [Reyranella sp. CPCC 100927]
MRIAQIAPLYEAVPPVLYGGTERTVAHLADALVDLGHDVTLFASAEARTKAELVAMRDQAIRLDPSPLKSDLAAHLTLLHEVRRLEDTFDVLHFHTDMLHFPFFEHRATRTLTTVHGRLDLKDLSNAYRRWHTYPLVSISDNQRAPLRFANWMATVHHGLPPDLYQPSSDGRDGYLAFLGRISPEKRPDRAIAIARQANLPLRIAAKVDPVDRTYFHETIEPLLDQPGIDFIGEIGDDQKAAFLGNARALLFPIDWPEPFGLVMIEAMACGTPVVAWKEGAVTEIVDHGVTGFIVQTEAEAVDAVRRLDMLDRRHVRQVFERRFSSFTMADKYLALYRRLTRLDDDDLDHPLLQTAGE